MLLFVTKNNSRIEKRENLHIYFKPYYSATEQQIRGIYFSNYRQYAKFSLFGLGHGLMSKERLFLVWVCKSGWVGGLGVRGGCVVIYLFIYLLNAMMHTSPTYSANKIYIKR